jgi:hypothetical protein
MSYWEKEISIYEIMTLLGIPRDGYDELWGYIKQGLPVLSKRPVMGLPHYIDPNDPWLEKSFKAKPHVVMMPWEGYKSEIEEWKKENTPEELPEKHPTLTEESKPVINFYPENGTWRIGDRSLPKLKGYEHIHFLLDNQIKNFKPSQVYHAGKVLTEIREMDHQEIKESRLTIVDEKSYQEFRKVPTRKLKKLKENYEQELREESDKEERKTISSRIKLIDTALKEKFVLKGEEEKIRITVRQNIDKALKTIHEETPELKPYLNDKTIEFSKGTFSYFPDTSQDPVKWKLEPTE